MERAAKDPSGSDFKSKLQERERERTRAGQRETLRETSSAATLLLY